MFHIMLKLHSKVCHFYTEILEPHYLVSDTRSRLDMARCGLPAEIILVQVPGKEPDPGTRGSTAF